MLLNSVKNAMRIDGTYHDEELTELIDTAKLLLKEVGVLEVKIIDEDPLIRKAVITYCKANFGIDASGGEKFAGAFEEMKKLLSLLSSYTEPEAIA
ncbi:head-tail connector protein [Sporosarcina sp. FSL K6-1522]|uniref:head-tail connector protein n=1 Tax=Sporosarcina sp. FSL K6-1522 TaxID=2921554 RepID=UPI0031599AED